MSESIGFLDTFDRNGLTCHCTNLGIILLTGQWIMIVGDCHCFEFEYKHGICHYIDKLLLNGLGNIAVADMSFKLQFHEFIN